MSNKPILNDTSDDDLDDFMDFNDNICKENLKKGCMFLSDIRKKTYVGITNADSTEYYTVGVQFLKRQPSIHDQRVFVFPVNGDSDEADIEDIAMLLPPKQGVVAKTTSRRLVVKEGVVAKTTSRRLVVKQGVVARRSINGWW